MPAVTAEILSDFLYRLLFPELRLGIKLIREADDFLLQAYRTHVSMRNRQLAVDDGFEAQACTCVPFTNQPMLGITLYREQLSPQITMTNIREATLWQAHLPYPELHL